MSGEFISESVRRKPCSADATRRDRWHYRRHWAARHRGVIGRRCRRWPIAPVGAIRKGIDAVVQERIRRDVVCPGRGRFPPPGALRYTVDSVLAD